MASGKLIWDHSPGVNIFKLLMRIRRDELPQIPENLCEEGKDFLGKCFVKDLRKLKSYFGGSPFPRGNFDFLDWVSMASYGISLGFGDFFGFGVLDLGISPEEAQALPHPLQHCLLLSATEPATTTLQTQPLAWPLL
ncbi:hypothetical protein PRUPE_2G016400 [Prunus persica]|uniref:Uncharacterized protein n=1 Tax=Prunus persica TaxID=3760 RepID=M5X5X4_PRUPE|nr:hypothetical protein PRUPE_2G016400 [Prunus persica]